MKATCKELWLGDFRLRSTKNLDVPREILVNGTGRKVITLESIDMCCMAWHTIHGVSKMEFYRQTAYAKEGWQSHYHGNMSLKKPMETTMQTIATMATIIVPLVDTMLQEIRKFAIGEKVVEKVLPTCTKWKYILLDVNVVGEKAGLEPILLSELSAIKKISFRE